MVLSTTTIVVLLGWFLQGQASQGSGARTQSGSASREQVSHLCPDPPRGRSSTFYFGGHGGRSVAGCQWHGSLHARFAEGAYTVPQGRGEASETPGEQRYQGATVGSVPERELRAAFLEQKRLFTRDVAAIERDLEQALIASKQAVSQVQAIAHGSATTAPMQVATVSPDEEDAWARLIHTPQAVEGLSQDAMLAEALQEATGSASAKIVFDAQEGHHCWGPSYCCPTEACCSTPFLHLLLSLRVEGFLTLFPTLPQGGYTPPSTLLVDP